jgi:hypothetical protein
MPEPITLEELVKRAELAGIDCYELFGARGAIEDDGQRRVVGPGGVDDVEFQVSNSLGVYWNTERGSFLVRLSCELTSIVGDVKVGVQAEYVGEGLGRDNVSPDVEEEYVNSVSVMTLAPFLREAVADVSRRTLGGPLMLGVLRRGELRFRSSRRNDADAQPDDSTPSPI